MSLFITSLNSGSNGNCYYIGNHNEAILVDAGISCRETEKRMKRLGLSMPGLALAHQLYLSLAAQGHARDGTHALELALASMAGVDWNNR